MPRCLRLAISAIVSTLALSGSADAQRPFALGLGGGTGFGSRGGDAKAEHGMAYLQLNVPLLPDIRAEGIVTRTGGSPSTTTSAGAAAVISLPIPIVKPYVILGYGHYGIGRDGAKSGWNAGVGIKASVGAGVFLELRRHDRILRDLLTLGISF